MSVPLTPVLLDADNYSLVDNFACGDEPWALNATAWLSGPSVAQAIHRGNQIILYQVPSLEVAGFGSLGQTTWAALSEDPIAFIPMLAVYTAWQGQGFCRIILQDPLQRASETPHKFVGLFVHRGGYPSR